MVFYLLEILFIKLNIATSHVTNPRTPFNSTVGVSRRTSPPLPPIKRSLTASKSPPPIDEGTNKKNFYSKLFL